MGKRRKAREVALQFLYQLDLQGEDDPDACTRRVLVAPPRRQRDPRVRRSPGAGHQGDTRRRSTSVISQFAEHWDLERMAVVDRNILRLAVYELLWHRRRAAEGRHQRGHRDRQEVRDAGVEPIHQRRARPHPQRAPSGLLRPLPCVTRSSPTSTATSRRSRPCWPTRCRADRRGPVSRRRRRLRRRSRGVRRDRRGARARWSRRQSRARRGRPPRPRLVQLAMRAPPRSGRESDWMTITGRTWPGSRWSRRSGDATLVHASPDQPGRVGLPGDGARTASTRSRRSPPGSASSATRTVPAAWSLGSAGPDYVPRPDRSSRSTPAAATSSTSAASASRATATPAPPTPIWDVERAARS